MKYKLGYKQTLLSSKFRRIDNNISSLGSRSGCPSDIQNTPLYFLILTPVFLGDITISPKSLRFYLVYSRSSNSLSVSSETQMSETTYSFVIICNQIFKMNNQQHSIVKYGFIVHNNDRLHPHEITSLYLTFFTPNCHFFCIIRIVYLEYDRSEINRL